jgi:excisionase family DNA binding protein
MDFQHTVFTIAEAAQHLRVSRAFLYQLVAAKRLRPIKVGTRSLLTGAELGRFLSDATNASGGPR